jgi:hypothetical protein
MNDALAQLKAFRREKRLLREPTKPTKAPSVSFGSSEEDPVELGADSYKSDDRSTLGIGTGTTWDAEDWRTFFDERAGIAEFGGGLTRTQTETRAFECCVVEWLNRNPIRSSRGRCVLCGGGESADKPLLPHGVESTGHAWLHSVCWEPWYAGRKAKAVAAMAAIGIAGRQGEKA